MGGKLGKKVSDKVADVGLALIRTGENVAGEAGFKAANFLCATFLFHDWRPCDDTCEHNQPKR